jgi:hypothetical protein
MWNSPKNYIKNNLLSSKIEENMSSTCTNHVWTSSKNNFKLLILCMLDCGEGEGYSELCAKLHHTFPKLITFICFLWGLEFLICKFGIDTVTKLRWNSRTHGVLILGRQRNYFYNSYTLYYDFFIMNLYNTYICLTIK